MQEDSMEISINSDFTMKAGKGGKISVKMALNGKSTPNKVMNIEGPNEVYFFIQLIDLIVMILIFIQTN